MTSYMAGRCVDTGSAGGEPRGSHSDKYTITEHLTPWSLIGPREGNEKAPGKHTSGDWGTRRT